MRGKDVARGRSHEDRVRNAGHEARDNARKARRRAGKVHAAASWVVALTTGALVAWRGLAAARGPLPAAEDSGAAKRLLAARHAEEPIAEPTDRRIAGHASSDRSPQRGDSGTVGGSREVSRDEHLPGRASTQEADGTDPGSVTGLLGLAKEWFARFTRDECLTRSEALAFIAMLSLVPLLLFGLAVLGFVIRDPQRAADYVRSVITHQLPGQTATTANAVIDQTHLVDSARTLVARKWWAAALGIVLLLPSAIGLFVSATEPMNAAWEVKETRGFIKLRLICLATMIAAGVLFISSLVASSGAFHPQGVPTFVNVLLTVLYELIAVTLNSLMFVVIYRYLPNTRVTWRSALIGGATAGVLWEVAKKLFAYYVAHFGNFDKIYGTLGGLAGLVTWIWYSCVLLLGGAIVCKMVDEHSGNGAVRRVAS